jgi:hypothetical protein
MKEISDIFTYQSDLIVSIAMFYMIILSNTVKNILTCHQIHFLETNKYIILLTSFMLFYFLCSLVSNTGYLKYVPPIQKLLYSIIYFFVLLLTTRLDFKITFAVLALIFLLYFIQLNKSFYSNDDNSNSRNDLVSASLKNDYKNYWITIDFPFRIRLIEFNKSHLEFIKKIERILYIIIYVLIVLGVISYGGEIKDTFKNKKNVTWHDVFLNNEICNIKDRLPFMHYLKLGLGLKI